MKTLLVLVQDRLTQSICDLVEQFFFAVSPETKAHLVALTPFDARVDLTRLGHALINPYLFVRPDCIISLCLDRDEGSILAQYGYLRRMFQSTVFFWIYDGTQTPPNIAHTLLCDKLVAIYDSSSLGIKEMLSADLLRFLDRDGEPDVTERENQLSTMKVAWADRLSEVQFERFAIYARENGHPVLIELVERIQFLRASRWSRKMPSP